MSDLNSKAVFIRARSDEHKEERLTQIKEATAELFAKWTYNVETPCCNSHPISVLLIMTSKAPDTMYTGLIENYKNTLTRFVGPAETFVSGNTLQLKDYSKNDWFWTLFNPEEKIHRHEIVFPEECKKVFELRKRIFK